MSRRLLPSLVTLLAAMLAACEAGGEASPPGPTPSTSASTSARTGAPPGDLPAECRVISDRQLSAWVGAPQQVDGFAAPTVECVGSHLEFDEPILVSWRLHDHPPSRRLGLDRSRVPVAVVLRADVGDRYIVVTVSNSSPNQLIPVPRLTRIARKVAAAYR